MSDLGEFPGKNLAGRGLSVPKDQLGKIPIICCFLFCVAFMFWHHLPLFDSCTRDGEEMQEGKKVGTQQSLKPACGT